jgi:uncharacterized protein YlxW (UPF0749 family)
MSKAIYGHLAGSDAALLAEVNRLRRRVRELEEQVAGLEAAQVALHPDVVSLHDAELDEALQSLQSSAPALA